MGKMENAEIHRYVFIKPKCIAPSQLEQHKKQQQQKKRKKYRQMRV